MIEEWRNIDKYEGIFQVSNYGNVRSIGRDIFTQFGGTRFICGRTMKLNHDNCGYLYASLTHKGKQKKFKVHRLVAAAFIPNTRNLTDVNHIDEIKDNNIVTNLQWVTSRANKNYTPKKNMSSKHPGVSWYKPLNKWRAYCNVKSKQHHLGYFNEEIDAAKAYIDFCNNNNFIYKV